MDMEQIYFDLEEDIQKMRSSQVVVSEETLALDESRAKSDEDRAFATIVNQYHMRTSIIHSQQKRLFWMIDQWFAIRTAGNELHPDDVKEVAKNTILLNESLCAYRAIRDRLRILNTRRRRTERIPGEFGDLLAGDILKALSERDESVECGENAVLTATWYV